MSQPYDFGVERVNRAMGGVPVIPVPAEVVAKMPGGKSAC